MAMFAGAVFGATPAPAAAPAFGAFGAAAPAAFGAAPLAAPGGQLAAKPAGPPHEPTRNKVLALRECMPCLEWLVENLVDLAETLEQQRSAQEWADVDAGKLLQHILDALEEVERTCTKYSPKELAMSVLLRDQLKLVAPNLQAGRPEDASLWTSGILTGTGVEGKMKAKQMKADMIQGVQEISRALRVDPLYCAYFLFESVMPDHEGVLSASVSADVSKNWWLMAAVERFFGQRFVLFQILSSLARASSAIMMFEGRHGAEAPPIPQLQKLRAWLQSQCGPRKDAQGESVLEELLIHTRYFSKMSRRGAARTRLALNQKDSYDIEKLALREQRVAAECVFFLARADMAGDFDQQDVAQSKPDEASCMSFQFDGALETFHPLKEAALVIKELFNAWDEEQVVWRFDESAQYTDSQVPRFPHIESPAGQPGIYPDVNFELAQQTDRLYIVSLLSLAWGEAVVFSLLRSLKRKNGSQLAELELHELKELHDVIKEPRTSRQASWHGFDKLLHLFLAVGIHTSTGGDDKIEGPAANPTWKVSVNELWEVAKDRQGVAFECLCEVVLPSICLKSSVPFAPLQWVHNFMLLGVAGDSEAGYRSFALEQIMHATENEGQKWEAVAGHPYSYVRAWGQVYERVSTCLHGGGLEIDDARWFAQDLYLAGDPLADWSVRAERDREQPTPAQNFLMWAIEHGWGPVTEISVTRTSLDAFHALCTLLQGFCGGADGYCMYDDSDPISEAIRGIFLKLQTDGWWDALFRGMNHLEQHPEQSPTRENDQRVCQWLLSLMARLIGCMPDVQRRSLIDEATNRVAEGAPNISVDDWLKLLQKLCVTDVSLRVRGSVFAFIGSMCCGSQRMNLSSALTVVPENAQISDQINTWFDGTGALTGAAFEWFNDSELLVKPDDDSDGSSQLLDSPLMEELRRQEEQKDYTPLCRFLRMMSGLLSPQSRTLTVDMAHAANSFADNLVRFIRSEVFKNISTRDYQKRRFAQQWEIMEHSLTVLRMIVAAPSDVCQDARKQITDDLKEIGAGETSGAGPRFPLKEIVVRLLQVAPDSLAFGQGNDTEGYRMISAVAEAVKLVDESVVSLAKLALQYEPPLRDTVDTSVRIAEAEEAKQILGKPERRCLLLHANLRVHDREPVLARNVLSLLRRYHFHDLRTNEVLTRPTDVHQVRKDFDELLGALDQYADLALSTLDFMLRQAKDWAKQRPAESTPALVHVLMGWAAGGYTAASENLEQPDRLRHMLESTIAQLHQGFEPAQRETDNYEFFYARNCAEFADMNLNLLQTLLLDSRCGRTIWRAMVGFDSDGHTATTSTPVHDLLHCDDIDVGQAAPADQASLFRLCTTTVPTKFSEMSEFLSREQDDRVGDAWLDNGEMLRLETVWLFQYTYWMRLQSVALRFYKSKTPDISHRLVGALIRGHGDGGATVVSMLQKLSIWKGLPLKPPLGFEALSEGANPLPAEFWQALPASAYTSSERLQHGVRRIHLERAKAPEQQRLRLDKTDLPHLDYLVHAHNLYLSALAASTSSFESWAELTSIVVTEHWAAGNHADELRQLVQALLGVVYSWAVSCAHRHPTLQSEMEPLRQVLPACTQLLATAMQYLALAKSPGSRADELAPRQGEMTPVRRLELLRADGHEMVAPRHVLLEALLESIAQCPHDASVRGSLYLSMVHLLRWCEQSRPTIAGGREAMNEQAEATAIQNVFMAAASGDGARPSVVSLLAADAAVEAMASTQRAAGELPDPSLPRTLVQTIALGALEAILRADCRQGRVLQRLDSDNILQRVLLPSASAPLLYTALLETSDSDNATQKQLLVEEARLGLTSAVASLDTRARSAVWTLWPRLRECWGFLTSEYLGSHEIKRLARFLPRDASLQAGELALKFEHDPWRRAGGVAAAWAFQCSSDCTSPVRFHALAAPVLQTVINLLVRLPENWELLERVAELLKDSETFVKHVFDNADSDLEQHKYPQPVLSQTTLEQTLLISRLMHLVQLGYTRWARTKHSNGTADLRLFWSAEVSDKFANLLARFADRFAETYFFKREIFEREDPYADKKPRHLMVQIARNAIAVLHWRQQDHFHEDGVYSSISDQESKDCLDKLRQKVRSLQRLLQEHHAELRVQGAGIGGDERFFISLRRFYDSDARFHDQYSRKYTKWLETCTELLDRTLQDYLSVSIGSAQVASLCSGYYQIAKVLLVMSRTTDAAREMQ